MPEHNNRHAFYYPLVAAAVLFLGLLTLQAQPPAEGANKFLGNITSRGQVRSDFGQYWNQITAENEHKWSSVERNRDQMNWGGGDAVADYAAQADVLWKFHTLVWGSQYPNWITGLSQQEQLQEIEEWYDLAKAQYPEIPMIDVVNEAHPNHAPAPFRQALGGEGATGYDWIIKSFEMARERWPNAILIYNDYNIIEWNDEVNWVVDMVNTLLEAGAPIDAIGAQAHDAYRIDSATLQNNLDKVASTGLPIFISEFDIPETDDNTQLNIMQDKMKIFWNHPAVVGVTLWGYIVGQTWKNGTGLLTTGGQARPALTWLMDYIEQNPNPPNDFWSLLRLGTASVKPGGYLNTSDLFNSNRPLKVFDMQGREIGSFHGGPTDLMESALPKKPGAYIIHDGAHSQVLQIVR